MNQFLRKKRTDLNKYKLEFARETKMRTLEDALKGADVFLGLSKAGLVSKKMLKSMAKDPIVFAMANPDPEILPELAHLTRNDIVMATGRSDYPNQINNVLGFPYIFRGALDVRASKITEEMLVACVHALSALAHEPVPKKVLEAYELSLFEPELGHVELQVRLVEQAENDLLTMLRGQHGHAEVHLPALAQLELDAAILGQSALGDVQ